jgi:flagellar hook-length control protein FliK
VQTSARAVPDICSASGLTGLVQSAIRGEATDDDSSPPSSPEQTPESSAGPEIELAEAPESGEPIEIESWAWPSDETADPHAALAQSEVGPIPLREGPSAARAHAEAVGHGGGLGRAHVGTISPALRDGLAAAAAPSPTAAPGLAALAGQPTERAQDILRQIQLHWSAGAQRAVIHLQPAELGRIAIRLNVREGRVHAELRVERAATLEELNATLPELEELFSRHGLASGELELRLGFEQGSKRDSSQARPHRSAGSGSAPEHLIRGAAASAPSNPAASVAASPALMGALAAQLGVDTFA